MLPAAPARHGSHVVDAQALRFSGSKWSFADAMVNVKKTGSGVERITPPEKERLQPENA